MNLMPPGTQQGDRQPGMRIRRATADDATSIASVLSRSFAEYESCYTPEAFRATTLTPDEIQGRLNEGPTWVALAEETVVGTVSAVSKGEALYLRSMAVAPTARGKGVGRQLLEYAEEFAVQHRFERLLLSTTPFLTSAIRLYEQCGFGRSDEGPEDLFGTPLWTLVKVLRGAIE